MKQILLLILVSVFCSCTSSLFEPIGTNTSSPITVAVDATNSRAYVVNSNQRLKYEDATVMVLDITNPEVPTLVSTAAIPNLSAESYFDAATRQVYITNRESDHNGDLVDRLLKVDVSTDSPLVTEYHAGDNPFGIVCCDSGGRFFVVNYGGSFYRYDTADLSTNTAINLDVTLSTDEPVQGVGANSLTLIGQQAFVSTRAGEIFVINLDEIGGATDPIDYVLYSSYDLRGIASDGTNLYIVNNSETTPAVFVVDPASLTANTDSTFTDQALDDLIGTTISLTAGDDPNEILYYATLNQFYVAKTGADTVDVIDPVSKAVSATLTLNSGSFTANEPFGLTAFNDGTSDYLYVANLGSDNISIVNLGTQVVVGSYP